MNDLDKLYYSQAGHSPSSRAAGSKDGLPIFRSRGEEEPLHDPANYLVDAELAAAINTAIILGRPLFVTGEPGTGKSELACHIAWRLELGDCVRFEIKSTSKAHDLFYSFDNLRQFRDANLAKAGVASSQSGDTDWVRPYLTIHGLGRAILRTYTPDQPEVQRFWNTERYGPFDGPRRSVVLVDEIDKAPRELTNDLLNEIDQHFFRLVEDEGRIIKVQNGLVPLIVFTSNAEKHMPEAFLRRCVYLHLRFPDLSDEDPTKKSEAEERLRQILSNRLGNTFPTSCPLLDDCIELVRNLRADNLRLAKPPSIAELLDWLKVLRAMGMGPNDRLKGWSALQETVGLLLKHREDLAVVKSRVLQAWV